MPELWPRISAPVARSIFERTGPASVEDFVASSATQHPQETFAASGGSRVERDQIEQLVRRVRETAQEFGYPRRAPDTERIRFDRAAAEIVYTAMDITAFEAGQRGVWSFLAVVAMPDVTWWRFERSNVERWVASDLTRHMFSRLWWQALTFGTPTPGGLDFRLLRALTESDLNQIMERRTLAGNGRLARALGRAVVSASGPRREVIRDLTPRLRRRLAFIEFSGLSDEQIDDHVRALLATVSS